MQFLFYILLIFAFYCSVFRAPKSCHTILQNTDGQVMPAGTLANLENLSFDVLVCDYLGTLFMPECQHNIASLVKYSSSQDGYTVCTN